LFLGLIACVVVALYLVATGHLLASVDVVVPTILAMVQLCANVHPLPARH
jgi:hypothetical protein